MGLDARLSVTPFLPDATEPPQDKRHERQERRYDDEHHDCQRKSSSMVLAPFALRPFIIALVWPLQAHLQSCMLLADRSRRGSRSPH
jgi:hypothetical protein